MDINSHPSLENHPRCPRCQAVLNTVVAMVTSNVYIANPIYSNAVLVTHAIQTLI